CYAVRPQGLSWPQREDGLVSFKLEQLTAANGLAHESAHDALSDVYATLNLARLIKQQQPRLFDHLFQLRHKKVAQQALELGSNKPKLHISSRFGAEHACASLILPVVEHPVNKNEILCVDLRYSPAPLLELPAEELQLLQYTKVAELPNGIERIPLKSVHINRCPVVLSPGLIDAAVAERMSLDLQRCEQHRQQLIGYAELAEKLRAMAALHSFDDSNKVAEEKLYSGFIPRQDQQALHEIPALNAEQLAARHFSFVDQRLPDLLFRYRARNFPHSLTAAERLEWLEYCRDRLLGPTGDSLVSELEKIDQLLQSSTEAEQTLLSLTKQYLQQQCATLNQAH
ncbi:MAG: exodeoxyribonuclease I, partial [Gammaproteobacteria bacterium]|nr:exodeoxyribonuclease I [Gammaproteobacteria bacterium]